MGRERQIDRQTGKQAEKERLRKKEKQEKINRES